MDFVQQKSSSFSKEYFSGTNIQIYFGDTWIKEATGLEYTLTENVAPIYGFASHTFDRIARGTRLVQGSFTINFEESGYLQTVLHRLSNKMNQASESSTGVVYEDIEKGILKNGGLSSLTIEQLLKAEGLTYSEAIKSFQDAYWGEGTLGRQYENRERGTYFNPVNPDMPDIGTFNEMDQAGFNILVNFGRNIDLSRAKCFNGAIDNSVKTTQTIMNVQLTGVSKMIGLGNQPVQEQYQFVAKDLDGIYLEKA